MSGKSKRATKRRRQGDLPLDLKGKVLQGDSAGFGLETLDSEAENRDPNDHGVPSRHSGIYGDSARSVASRDILRSSGSRRFLKSRSSRGQQGAPLGHSDPSSARSVASVSTRNPYRASAPRSRHDSNASVRSTATARRRAMTPKPAVHIVCAIGENLARETCIASLDAGTPISLQVTKQANGQTYAETMAYLQMLKPHEVLLNEGRKNSPLARKIVQLYEVQNPNVPIDINDAGEDQTVVKFISRSCFDQTKGAELLRKLARTDTFDPTLVEEYILLSSSHAVLHYTQHTLGASFSRKCLDVVVNSGGKNRMSIDRSTLLQLELLVNAKTGKPQNSLVSSIDCTKTTVGTRLLRSTLMAPPSRSDTINARLDLVDSFLGDEDFFYSVLEHLQNLPAVDKMLTNIAVVPKVELRKAAEKGESPVVTARLASRGISALVCIKSTLSALPALAGVLQDHLTNLEAEMGNQNDGATAFTGRSSLLVGLGGGPASTGPPHQNYLLRAIVQALTQPQLAEVCAAVSEVFTESTAYVRNAAKMSHQECFALKSPENGMMAILRKAFLRNIDDIYKKADTYAEIHGMNVSVRYTASRGYFLSVPADMAAELPNIFIQPIKSGNFIYCTTEEVHSLNIRAQDNVQDLLLMTYELIQEVMEEARSKYDALAALADAIALLDLCHGFADKVLLSKMPWSRPILKGDESGGGGNGGGILIRNGRYAIDVNDSYLNSSEGPTHVIPNDTYATPKKPFTVISGINGSGKSTYLKQIAIIVLLAHCGSYVPAEQASIPLRNRLCVRMGSADDQENNISSFMLEMKETAFICSNATEKSLVLLDELGRATSNEDGVTIAWAVAEFLLMKGAMTFFVTHYPQLSQLSKVYPSVQNQHLSASISTEGTGDIRYTHKLTPGPCTAIPDYGIEMATSCGWPADVVESARNIKRDLQGQLLDGDFSSNLATQQEDATSSAACTSFLKRLSKKLAEVVLGENSIASLRSKLQRLQTATSQNPKVPLENLKNSLAVLLQNLQEAPASRRSLAPSVMCIAFDDSQTLAGDRAEASDGCFEQPPRVSAPGGSSDDDSLTSDGSTSGSED